MGKDLVMKAFETSAMGITSIVFHENAGKARYTTLYTAHDAGYDSVKMIDIKVRRRPELDEALTFDGKRPEWRKCYGVDCIEGAE